MVPATKKTIIIYELQENNMKHQTFIIALLFCFSLTGKLAVAQQVKEGPEFECLKKWSTGSEYLKNQEYDQAVPFFRQTIQCDKKLHPAKDSRKFVTVFDKLAECYFNMKQYDSAVMVYKEGFAEFQESQYIYKIGEMYHKSLKNYDSAAFYYREYFKLTKSNEELKRIAGMWVEAGKYKDAVAVYEEYLNIDTQDEETWRYVLDSFKSFYIRQYGKDRWFKRCEDFSKHFPKASKEFYIGDKLDELLKQGQYENAANTALEILKTDSAGKQTWWKLGKAYDALQKRKEALDAFEKAYQIDPNDADLMCDYAQSALDGGQLVKTWTLGAKAGQIKKFGRPYYLIGEAILDGIKKCSGNVLDMPAKEAYLVAAKYYDIAAQYPDTEKNAKVRASSCRQNGPTKGDCHMGALGKLAGSACYSWMLDKDYANPCK